MTTKEKIRRAKAVEELITFDGWNFIKDEINKRIDMAKKDLINGSFSDLIDVKEKQIEISKYNELFIVIDGIIAEGKRLSSFKEDTTSSALF